MLLSLGHLIQSLSRPSLCYHQTMHEEAHFSTAIYLMIISNNDNKADLRSDTDKTLIYSGKEKKEYLAHNIENWHLTVLLKNSAL